MKRVFLSLVFSFLTGSLVQARPIESFRTPKSILIAAKYCYPNALMLASVVQQVIPVVLLVDQNCSFNGLQIQPNIQPDSIPTTFSRDWGPLFLDLEPIGLTMANYRYYPKKEVPLLFPSKAMLSGLKVQLAGGNLQVDVDGTCITAYPQSLQNGEEYKEIEKDLYAIGCTRVIAMEPAFAEKTYHVDIFFQVVGPQTVVLADYSANEYAKARRSMDQNLEILKNAGFKVARIPQPGTISDEKNNWVHVSYVNSLVVGKNVFVPAYGLSYDAPAVKAWKEVGFEVIEVPQELPYYDGSIHCLSSPIY